MIVAINDAINTGYLNPEAFTSSSVLSIVTRQHSSTRSVYSIVLHLQIGFRLASNLCAYEEVLLLATVYIQTCLHAPVGITTDSPGPMVS